jgi:hypothetical protein
VTKFDSKDNNLSLSLITGLENLEREDGFCSISLSMFTLTKYWTYYTATFISPLEVFSTNKLQKIDWVDANDSLQNIYFLVFIFSLIIFSSRLSIFLKIRTFFKSSKMYNNMIQKTHAVNKIQSSKSVR